ncbi:MAG: pentapeptide repeat-containing protein [Rhodospirillales bacterium]|jgi:DNA-binding response OmpR family regulator|nr:pentapeptide repeat-containing protein [Rhodospirillales bacterium]MDP6884943.1 pentapeptide repeat-containing protein [Rhodospirillales bacterium]
MADFDWTNIRILVVDSDLDFLSWSDNTLREAGAADVRCTMVSGDVINILKQFAADAAVFDLEMEDGAALGALHQLRDEDTSPNAKIPVILKADPKNIKKFRQACDIGVESLFRKPVDTKTFLSRLRGAIRAPRRLIATDTYFGPDRRWGDHVFEGEDRRDVVAAANLEVEAVAAAVPDAEPHADDSGNKKARVNQELLHLLDDHGIWLQSGGKEGVRADLEGRDYYGATLNRADLTRANLQDVILTDANCMRATFKEADMTKADLSHGNFGGADFSRARLRSAVLAGTNMKGADLRGADLTEADLRGASLRDADLTDTVLVGADVKGADLRDAEGLTQDQLTKVRADAATRLSKDLRNPALKS